MNKIETIGNVQGAQAAAATQVTPALTTPVRSEGAGSSSQGITSAKSGSASDNSSARLNRNNPNTPATAVQNSDASSGLNANQVVGQSEGSATETEIRNAVDDLNSRLSSQEIAVNFDLDDDTGRIVVKVKDINSGKTIRQIPSESTLEFARNAEKGVGVLLDRQF